MFGFLVVSDKKKIMSNKSCIKSYKNRKKSVNNTQEV